MEQKHKNWGFVSWKVLLVESNCSRLCSECGIGFVKIEKHLLSIFVCVGTFLLKDLEVWFLCEMGSIIFIERYVILFIQEFLDTVMPVYVLKLSVHFMEVLFYVISWNYKTHYNSIPEIALGYCINIIYSVILRSALFLLFLIYQMALNVRYSVWHISNLWYAELDEILIFHSCFKAHKSMKVGKKERLKVLRCGRNL